MNTGTKCRVEMFAFLGRHVTLIGSYLLTFRDNLSVRFS